MMAEPLVFEATRENFAQLVLANSGRGLVVVDFWSPGAGPSLRQRVSALAREYGGRFLLVTVNSDQQPALTREYGVKSILSFKVFRHGKVVEEVRGVQIQADYKTIIEKHLKPLQDKVIRDAAVAWRRGEHERALRILADGAVAAPDNLALPVQMAKFLIQLKRNDDALQILSALPEPARNEAEIATLPAHLDILIAAADVPSERELKAAIAVDPDDHSARFQLAAVALLEDDYAASLASLVEILRRDKHSGGARRALLAVFDTLGPEHDLVRQYRGELFQLIH